MTTGSLVDQAQQLLQSLVGGDLVEITLLSLAVSGLATALSLLIGLPIAGMMSGGGVWPLARNETVWKPLIAQLTESPTWIRVRLGKNPLRSR